MEEPSTKGQTGPRAPHPEDSPVLTAEVSQAGPLTQTPVKSLELTAEQAKETERPSSTEQGTPDAFKSMILEADHPCSPPLATPTNPLSPQACGCERNTPCSASAPVDMDCLVCFNKYSVHRVPKVLACQHAFCAICLKLILRREEGAWTLTCPLCRAATPVPGGLIRTLQDKEEIMEHLEKPPPNPEGHVPAPGLDGNSWTRSGHDVLCREENVPADNRLAVQRLVLLLLLVVILTILILPFVYSGLVKWVICLVLVLGLVMSMVLCCTPKLYWRCNRDSLTSCHKETHITAIA
ncbi:PREDICTED: RING finger protein 186 [Merops nubicus]|uniref:RING finger protein 186 n=1 Tax=Merops nubicus TaxID=57421 RepID=UPI0004F07BA0|nr:PREDICTED: RING finger protein 186 [Merops nubicus]